MEAALAPAPAPAARPLRAIGSKVHFVFEEMSSDCFVLRRAYEDDASADAARAELIDDTCTWLPELLATFSALVDDLVLGKRRICATMVHDTRRKHFDLRVTWHATVPVVRTDQVESIARVRAGVVSETVLAAVRSASPA